jgi:tetratricopeptide (TPR) repeat protein
MLSGILLVAALIAAPVRLRGSAAARALAALAIALAIPLHLVATLPALCAERFLYLPMAFVGLAAAAIVGTAMRRTARPSAVRDAKPSLRSGGLLAAVLTIVVLIFGARSAVRATDWRSEIALFETSARAKPGSARLHNALGLAYANSGQEERAESEYRRALEVYPDYAAALVNLGNVELRRGDAAAARDRYVRAIALDPGYIKARWNLAVALETLGDVNGAAREYAEIAARDATHFESRLRLGEILVAAGRGREAERALSEALALRPGDAAARRALASARATSHER